MPIKIPNDLPAKKIHESENIFVMTKLRADTQDIRPLKILLVNLMPTKIDTETQFARLLGNTALQIELDLLAPKSHISINTKAEYSTPAEPSSRSLPRRRAESASCRRRICRFHLWSAQRRPSYR